MLTIVYASQSVQKMDPAGLTELLSVARARNAGHGVTGMLLYAYESFMQQLEGEDDAVDSIFASIQRDPRHRNLRLLDRRTITERRYPGWAMGFEHPQSDALTVRLPGYLTSIDLPLVSSELVPNTAIAEALLGLSATAAGPAAETNRT